MARSSLPPGFRFHPTDVELVQYYLKRKVLGKKLRIHAIAVVDIYKFGPWDLPAKSCLRTRDLEWYFFCPRDKKHPNSARTNRATETGYWKTTGKDRPIIYESRSVGMKKTLVFHLGRAPHGTRTDWVIHEYRLEDKQLADAGIKQDAYVLCRLFEKSGPGPKNGEQYGAPFVEEEWDDDEVEGGQLELPFSDHASSSHTEEVVDAGSVAQSLPVLALTGPSGPDVQSAALVADHVPPPVYIPEGGIPTEEADEIDALIARLLSDEDNMILTEQVPAGLEQHAVAPLVIEASSEFDQEQFFAALDNPNSQGMLPHNTNDDIAFGMEAELLQLGGGSADSDMYGTADEVTQGTFDWQYQYPMADQGEVAVYNQQGIAAAPSASNGNNTHQPASSWSCYSSTTDYYYS